MTFDLAPFRHLYPFESHYLDRGGIAYHYLDEGKGEPLVLLHGNPTWSLYFRELILALRDSYRVIVPDHIGCGLSDKPDDSRYRYTLKSRVDDLEALLEHLKINENITLILHDWGGGIGMGYASRYPERIARLVVMNTAAFLLPKTKTFPWTLSIARDLKIGAFLVRAFNAFSFVATYVAAKRPLSREVRLAYRAPYNSWRNRIATLRFVQDIPVKPNDPAYPIMKEIEEGLERFRSVPMLICWGEKDFVFDRHFLARWCEFFPEAEVHPYPDAGHYVLEDAHEQIVPLVRNFLLAHPLNKKSV